MAQAFPSGEAWCQHMMEEVKQCFEDNADDFENQGPGGIIIYGLEKGKIGLREQVALLALNVPKKKRKLRTKSGSYKIYDENDLRDNEANKGSVLIKGIEAGQYPIVWVEENQISLIGKSTPSVPSDSTASSSK